jgi:dethiobiotin synthetase
MKSKGLFITATGTDAGKTFVSALIVKKLKSFGLNAGYYKAALSGITRRADGTIVSDASYAAEAAGLEDDPRDLVSYVYETAVSPHLAAKLEGNPPELDVIRRDYHRLCARHEYMVVEGSGGVICPLRCDGEGLLMLEDVIAALDLGVLVVGNCGLGSINAAALTLEYLKARRLPVKGIVINRYRPGVMEDDNIFMIKKLTQTPVVAVLKDDCRDIDINEALLKTLFAR